MSITNHIMLHCDYDHLKIIVKSVTWDTMGDFVMQYQYLIISEYM